MSGTPLNPLASLDDLADFAPTGVKKPTPPKEVVDQLAAAHNFPSRQAAAPTPDKRPVRRRRTGRNVQFNIRASDIGKENFYLLADMMGSTLGETLDKCVDAMVEKIKANPHLRKNKAVAWPDTPASDIEDTGEGA